MVRKPPWSRDLTGRKSYQTWGWAFGRKGMHRAKATEAGTTTQTQSSQLPAMPKQERVTSATCFQVNVKEKKNKTDL